MPDAIHLVYGSDDNYWFYTAISAASAAHGCSAPLTLHLFDIGISDEHYAEYERLVRRAGGAVTFVRHRLKTEDFAKFGAWKGSLVTYSRMFMAELLPGLDWAIYVDGDTLWLGDIAKLWALRDETKLIQASVDPPFVDGTICPDRKWYAAQGLEIDPNAYLCMGLMMANLRKMREEKIADGCRAFLAKYPTPGIVDQTVLNYVCKGRLTPLPKQWGVFSAWHVGVDLSDGGCVHYVTDVPWRRDKLNRLLSDIVLVWYDFAREVLGLDLLPQYVPWYGRLWRRAAFVFLKHNQWILSLHPYLRGHLRNTGGLADGRWRAISQRT